MPSAITVGTSGGNKDVGSITVGTAGGNKAVLTGYVGTASGNRVFFTSMTATATPDALGASGISINITTASCTVTPNDGVGPFTYAWAKVSGGSITVNSSTAATTTFSAGGMTPGEVRVAVYRCTVTDTATGAEAQADVAVEIERSA